MNQVITLEPLSLTTLLLNSLIGIILSTGVAWYYARFGEGLSNRTKFARLIPVLCLTTILVISVVKASLALSLGLVGALSIVRFRTAIKDPEELI
jgi:multisubunit Na+/H+ antiporter MnhE subunit